MAAVAPGFLRDKHVIVFGAGYVGSAVVAAAVRQGAWVTALTRNASKVASLAAVGCEVVVDELSSESWHPKILGPVDYALDCVGSGNGGVDGYRRSYVEGLRSILAWAHKRPGIRTFVYTGSTSVYPQSGGARVEEDASLADPVGTVGVLIEAEEGVRNCGAVFDRTFIFRLAGIYGPARHRLLDQLREGVDTLPGSGDHRLNLIHRDDAVGAVLAAFGAPATVSGGTFNLADDAPATRSEVVGWLCDRLQRPVPCFSGEPAAGRRAVTPDRIIANGRIKAHLGWTPRYPDFRAGYTALLEA